MIANQEIEKYSVKKILVPMDGSTESFRGLEKAIYFARQCNATITGLYTSQKPTKYGFDNIDDLDSASRKRIDKFMEKSKVLAAQNGISFQEEIIHGSAEKKILDFATKWKYQLIIIGSKNAGSKDKTFFEGVTNHILEKSKIPVLVVK